MSAEVHPPGLGHEHSDVVPRPIVIAGIGLAVALIVAGMIALGLFDLFAAYEARVSPPANPLAAAEGPRLPPEPRLQVHAIKDLRELHEAEDALLDHYGWVDKSTGAVRIPVERAIDLLAARAGQKATTP